ncbi:MAG: tetratricopeptide (TPR) repeat protein [Marivirga sp.]|jgi:tetratricopeptide (TPR) repeat protein
MVKIQSKYYFLICLVLISLTKSFSASKDGDNILKKKSSFISTLPEAYQEDFTELIQKLEKKSNNNEAYFLEHLFYKTHRKFLKQYRKHSALQELFKEGVYDCVSGSLLYASLLDHFDIAYDIVETDFHVFIIAYSTTGEEYILEATDPLYGFIKNERDIAEYKLKYQPRVGSFGLSSAIEIGDNTYFNGEENTIYNHINLSQLGGLQYYNKGIEALNGKNYEQAFDMLAKAHELYPSERITAILEICQSLAN